MTAARDLARAVNGAQLSEAFEAVADLLTLDTDRDVSRGPRWRAKSPQDLFGHLVRHAGRSCDPTSRDPDTGHLDAAHAAARALMILQLAIEHAEAEAEEHGPTPGSQL